MASIDFMQNMASTRSVVEIPVNLIKPDPNQPRRDFMEDDVPTVTQEALEALADSIKEQGVLQPILVRGIDDNNFMIIAGERRWRASQLAGLETIPCEIRNDLEGMSLELAQLSENMQRESLTDLDVAKKMKQLLDIYPQLQKKDLALMLNRKPSHVSRMMAMVDDRWAHLTSTGKISFASVLEQFKSLPADSQTKLANQAGSITHLDIQAEKKNLSVGATPMDAGDVGKSFVEGMGSVDEEEAQGKPDSSPAATPSKPSPAVNKVKNDSGENDFQLPRTTPNTPVAVESEKTYSLNLNILDLQKLAKRIDIVRPVKVELSKDVLRSALVKLSVDVPKSDEQWIDLLIEALESTR